MAREHELAQTSFKNERSIVPFWNFGVFAWLLTADESQEVQGWLTPATLGSAETCSQAQDNLRCERQQSQEAQER